MEVATTSHVIHDSPENGLKGKAVKKSGKRIGYNYIILKSLKESQKNDVVKCLYIKSLTNWGVCVIKEGTYGDSKDKDGRDIKDKLMWQRKLHQELQDKVRMPRLLGSFEESGNYYLVLERIKGKSLYKVITENNGEIRQELLKGTKNGLKFLDCLIQIVTILETLHKNNVVHRDVSAANFMIMPNGRVAIIDMELSYSLKQQLPTPPFQLGTYGYMSPEQETMQAPAIEQDIFSVGAILLFAWTGISPSKLTNANSQEIWDKTHFFIPDKLFASIVSKLLQPKKENRPSLEEVKQVIAQYKSDLQFHKQRLQNQPTVFKKEELNEIIQQAITALGSPLLADSKKGWFSEDMNAPKNIDKRKINKAWYTSFNRGAAGVVYLLSQAHSLNFDTSATIKQVQQALALIEEKYINRIDQVYPSLHFGASGIAASLSVAIKTGLIEAQTIYFDWINRLININNHKLDIMNGITGQGIAYLHCRPFLHEEHVKQQLYKYVQVIMEQQEKDGSWANEDAKKNKRVTRGFAHGAAGVIYFLTEYSKKYNDNDVLKSIERGLSWLIKKAVKKNNDIDWRSTKGNEIIPWWCEGAPGIALSFLNAYSLTGEPEYKEYACGALNNHSKNVLNNNLSQCHGLSGLGEIYIEAYTILKQQEWLDRAKWITQVIMQLRKEHNQYGTHWLVEHERNPVADFMIGNSGVIHFLMRYCYADKINFPMLKP